MSADTSSIEEFKKKKLIAKNCRNSERRERIATAAMQAIISNLDYFIDRGIASSREEHEYISQLATRYADSLISELDKESKNE